MSSDDIASQVIRRDESVDVPTKSPFFSTTLWGLVIALIGYAVTFAVRSKRIPEELAEQVKGAAVEIAVFVAGIIIAAVGRWRAKQPLSVTDARAVVKMKCLLPLLILLPLIGCVPGCAALTTSVPQAWVEADRATKNAVAPEYLQYVDNDPAKSQDQKDRRHRTVDTWETRIVEHEAAVKQPAQ